MPADEVRYQQIDHGFTKLLPVVRTSAGWRAATTTESPDAVVSRTFGPNNFAIITSGEIDGLTDLGAIGSTIGTPAIGRVVSATSVLINLQSYAGASVNTSSSTNIANKAENTVNITGQFSVTGGGNLTADRQLQLVNDVLSPGNNQHYGTNAIGTKGWYVTVAYQPLNTNLTTLSALANAAGVLTNNGAGVLTWGAGGGSSDEAFRRSWLGF